MVKTIKNAPSTKAGSLWLTSAECLNRSFWERRKLRRPTLAGRSGLSLVLQHHIFSGMRTANGGGDMRLIFQHRHQTDQEDPEARRRTRRASAASDVARP